MKPIISINNIGKQYRVNAPRTSHSSWREAFAEAVRSPLVHLKQRGQRGRQTFWALKDVNFEVYPGEIIGIVGSNGAGKSTLLKILSRIVEPTTGCVKLYGRVGSLLEVGTGFHPELSGRENVFLNGSILGMSRKEIGQKFDEIVAFADIDKFIDTPVKRYSSGMYVRLAFAVAAHLEPEILIVDEVLAVGDANFQKKCLGKMEDVSKRGRTIVFVSHNLGAVRWLCSRAVVIDKGELVANAPTNEALRTYYDIMRREKIDEKKNLDNRLSRCSGAVRFTKVSIGDSKGNENWDFVAGETIRINLSYRVFEDVPDLCIYVALHSGNANEVVTTVKQTLSFGPLTTNKAGSLVIEFPDVQLRAKEYNLYLWLGGTNGQPFDVIDQVSTSLPPIVISSDNADPHLASGYFSIPARVIVS